MHRLSWNMAKNTCGENERWSWQKVSENQLVTQPESNSLGKNGNVYFFCRNVAHLNLLWTVFLPANVCLFHSHSCKWLKSNSPVKMTKEWHLSQSIQRWMSKRTWLVPKKTTTTKHLLCCPAKTKMRIKLGVCFNKAGDVARGDATWTLENQDAKKNTNKRKFAHAKTFISTPEMYTICWRGLFYSA